MKTFNNEDFLIKMFRLLKRSNIVFNGRFLKCLFVWKSIKSRLLWRTWIDSSGKSDTPPDFFSKKLSLMMDVMRIDDSISKRNNSFKQTNDFISKNVDENLKRRDDISFFFKPNTRDEERYNFAGYFKMFTETLLNHSEKVPKYRINHPNIKSVILFVFDESNTYIQVSKEKDLLKTRQKKLYFENFKPHFQFLDKDFINVILKVKADFVIWMTNYKSLTVNNKNIKLPEACIYDVKRIRNRGVKYNHRLMVKVHD